MKFQYLVFTFLITSLLLTAGCNSGKYTKNTIPSPSGCIFNKEAAQYSPNINSYNCEGPKYSTSISLSITKNPKESIESMLNFARGEASRDNKHADVTIEKDYYVECGDNSYIYLFMTKSSYFKELPLNTVNGVVLKKAEPGDNFYSIHAAFVDDNLFVIMWAQADNQENIANANPLKYLNNMGFSCSNLNFETPLV